MTEHQKDVYLKTKDYLVTGDMFSLCYDKKRELLFTDPQPSTEDLPKYYKSRKYISHTDSKKGLISFLYQLIKKYTIQKKIRLIRSLNNGHGSLLDIGAGTGDFLKAAKQQGWKVYGVESNQEARKLVLEKGIELTEQINQLHNKKFEVITLWHVLEHLPNLEETILNIEQLLKPGGILIIAVPNYKSFDAKHYKSFWAAYDTPRHLWHFSRESMKNLFSEKWNLIKIKPMIFDSFYVSLLSEKNKTGKQNLIKAFFIGLASNYNAWKSNEYSSLIYCFRKEI